MATSYKLVLTHDERQAIDWIGHRYSHGDDLFKVLCRADWQRDDKPEDDDIEWSGDYPIRFSMEDETASLAYQCIIADNLACFSAALKEKLLTFCSPFQP